MDTLNRISMSVPQASLLVWVDVLLLLGLILLVWRVLSPVLGLILRTASLARDTDSDYCPWCGGSGLAGGRSGSGGHDNQPPEGY
jgi:hypothetical protein